MAALWSPRRQHLNHLVFVTGSWDLVGCHQIVLGESAFDSLENAKRGQVAGFPCTGAGTSRGFVLSSWTPAPKGHCLQALTAFLWETKLPLPQPLTCRIQSPGRIKDGLQTKMCFDSVQKYHTLP